MSKLRSVNTHFWNDNYIIDLDPIEKLLFLYLLTNPNTNMLGIYELHVRKIAFDTGIDKDMVLKVFDRFNDDGKASYIDGYVCLHNFTKHQSYNTNMKVSALNSFQELPDTVSKQGFIEPLLKALEPFPEGSEPIAEYELELEKEYETEYSYGDSSKWDKKQPVSHKSFVDAFNKLYDRSLRITESKREMIRGRLRTFTGEEIKTAWENRLNDDWLNGEGKEYLDNWAAAMRNDEKIEKYLNMNGSNGLDNNLIRKYGTG